MSYLNGKHALLAAEMPFTTPHTPPATFATSPTPASQIAAALEGGLLLAIMSGISLLLCTIAAAATM